MWLPAANVVCGGLSDWASREFAATPRKSMPERRAIEASPRKGASMQRAPI